MIIICIRVYKAFGCIYKGLIKRGIMKQKRPTIDSTTEEIEAYEPAKQWASQVSWFGRKQELLRIKNNRLHRLKSNLLLQNK